MQQTAILALIAALGLDSYGYVSKVIESENSMSSPRPIQTDDYESQGGPADKGTIPQQKTCGMPHCGM
jgi:hypothetical protein